MKIYKVLWLLLGIPKKPCDPRITKLMVSLNSVYVPENFLKKHKAIAQVDMVGNSSLSLNSKQGLAYGNPIGGIASDPVSTTITSESVGEFESLFSSVV